MKRLFLSTLTLILMTSTFSTLEAEASAIPVSVQKFENKAASTNCRYNWDWWGYNLGTAFADMLIEELGANPQYTVLERETISGIYHDEHELINSEETAPLKKGKFEKAKYVFVGSVTEFEYCVQKSKVGVSLATVGSLFGASLPDVNVGRSIVKTHVAVSIRVIDTTTGKIIRSAKGEAQLEDSDFKFDSDLITLDEQKNAPIGKTARAAIVDAVKKLEGALR